MSYTQLFYHIIFRTHHSVPSITVEHETLLYRYIWALVKAKGGTLYRIGGMPDHVHLFLQLPPSVAVADFVRVMKGSASSFMKAHPHEFPCFDGWGSAYCALSYSIHEKEKIVNYITNQKEHHKRVSFRDELNTLLAQYGIQLP